MSFEKGTVNIAFLQLSSKMPDNYLELFQNKAAGKLDDVTDKIQIGWVSGRHLLERKIDDQTSVFAGNLYVNLRCAQRKIPSALFKAECRKMELDYMLEKKISVVPAKIRAQIKKEVEEKRLMSMPPSISAIPAVFIPKDGSILLSASSPAKIAIFQELLEQTLNIKSTYLDFANFAEQLANVKVEKYQSLRFYQNAESGNELSGRDFLSWLWFHSETDEGRLTVKNNTYNCVFEGPLTFASDADAEGCMEISLRKGLPLRSAEAKSALKVGKKLKKAVVSITQGKNLWRTVFNADNFIFSSLALPEVEKLDPISFFDERISLICEFRKIIAEYLKMFFSAIESSQIKNTQKKILKWAEEREEY